MKQITVTGFADEITPHFDLQLAALREWGVTHLELRGADGVNISDFTPEKLREVKEKLNAAGIKVSSIGSPIGKIGIEDDFSAHLEKLKRTLEIQKALNAPYIRTFSFYLPQDKDPAEYRNQVFDRTGAMIEEAAKWDSVLLHENEKGIYGDTAPRCLALMEQFYGPHYKAVFDFANFVEVGQETLPAFAALRPYVEYVHIKDALWDTKQIVPAGKGGGHVQEILSNLISGGWRGFLSLEPHLTDFTGLAALEKDPAKRDSGMDGKTAWKLALDSLRDLLSAIPAAKETLA